MKEVRGNQRVTDDNPEGKYQTLENLIAAIGLPKEKVCTYCYDGCEGGCCGCHCQDAEETPEQK